MAHRLPPPMCACGHVYGGHMAGGKCQVIVQHNHANDDDDCQKCDRCGCGKFAVPRGSGTHRTGKARGWSMKSSPKKNTPWWR